MMQSSLQQPNTLSIKERLRRQDRSKGIFWSKDGTWALDTSEELPKEWIKTQQEKAMDKEDVKKLLNYCMKRVWVEYPNGIRVQGLLKNVTASYAVVWHELGGNTRYPHKDYKIITR